MGGVEENYKYDKFFGRQDIISGISHGFWTMRSEDFLSDADNDDDYEDDDDDDDYNNNGKENHDKNNHSKDIHNKDNHNKDDHNNYNKDKNNHNQEKLKHFVVYWLNIHIVIHH